MHAMDPTTGPLLAAMPVALSGRRRTLAASTMYAPSLRQPMTSNERIRIVSLGDYFTSR